MQRMTNRRVLVGRFGAPYGVKGEVRLQSFTKIPDAIAGYRPLTDSGGARQFPIKSVRHVKDRLFVARIAGIDDRTSAGSLTNVELFLPRDSLPPTSDDEFYLADLIGLSALDQNRAPLGRIKDVHDFGGGNILEIALLLGAETLLFPFTRGVVPEIDVAGGYVIIAPPVEIEAQDSQEMAQQNESSAKK
jgi:16S rRNA processing protein RimM